MLSFQENGYTRLGEWALKWNMMGMRPGLQRQVGRCQANDLVPTLEQDIGALHWQCALPQYDTGERVAGHLLVLVKELMQFTRSGFCQFSNPVVCIAQPLAKSVDQFQREFRVLAGQGNQWIAMEL